MDYVALIDYLISQDINGNFHVLDEEQYNIVKAFGVAEINEPLPKDSGYVYSGYVTFDWSGKYPLIVNL